MKSLIAYYSIDRIGSRLAKTYFFYTKKKELYVRAGCWFGTLAEFEKRIKEVHKGNNYEKEYMLAIGFAKGMIELR